MSNDPNRRSFLQATAGGLVVSSSLTSPDTRVTAANTETKHSIPVTGDVLRTTGQLSNDGKAII